MKAGDVADLLLLGALWGGSFLFMRMAAPEFGALPLAAMRVVGAAMLLLPLLALRKGSGVLRQHWRAIAIVGLTNSALPFMLFAYAALSIEAGVSATLNATAPLFGAVVAALWLREPIGAWRGCGLMIGLLGVAILVWDRIGLKAGATPFAAAVAIGLCLGAAAFYGFAANFVKKRLTGVAPLAVAAGSQLSASALLTLPALWTWPPANPSPSGWAAALALSFLCTGVAYVLYFRLIANIGATKAITVTFAVPAFAVLWGLLFLGERLSAVMLAGCVVILVGTGMAIGALRAPALHRRAI